MALPQAMKSRERAEGQRRWLEGLRSQAEGRRQAAEGLRKRGRATLSNCKAARDLMIHQASHLAAAVSKLEVPPHPPPLNPLEGTGHNTTRNLIIRKKQPLPPSDQRKNAFLAGAT
jgi:hypothetical protein